MVKNVFDLLNVFSNNPQKLFRVFEALSFDLLDLLHGVFLLFAPFKAFSEEVKYDEVEAPEVVPSRKVYAVMRIQRGKGHSPSEVGLLALGHWLLVFIQVTFSEAKVHNVNVFIVEREHKVGLE